MGTKLSNPKNKAAAAETAKTYYVSSLHMRHMLSLTGYEVTVTMYNVWERVACFGASKAVKTARKLLGITKSHPPIYETLLGVMFGAGLGPRDMKRGKETLGPPCLGFPVFLLWMWFLATASRDEMMSLMFHITDNQYRIGHLRSAEAAEGAMSRIVGRKAMTSSPSAMIRYRRWFHEALCVDVLRNSVQPCVNETGFVSLGRLFDTAGLLPQLPLLTTKAREAFGVGFWCDSAAGDEQRKRAGQAKESSCAMSFAILQHVNTVRLLHSQMTASKRRFGRSSRRPVTTAVGPARQQTHSCTCWRWADAQ